MASTSVVYYRDSDGVEPVSEFIDGLPPREQAAIVLQIERLHGLPPESPPPPFPHSSQIVGPLRELRCHYGSNLYRILYRRLGNLFVLLHMIRKGSRVIPPGDVEIAKSRWRNMKKRLDASPRKPPRPLGRDAVG